MIKKSHARPVEKNMADRLVQTAKRSEFEIILIDVQSVHYPRFGKEKSSDKLKKQSQKRFRNYPKVEHPGRILPQDQNLPFVNHGNGTSN